MVERAQELSGSRWLRKGALGCLTFIVIIALGLLSLRGCLVEMGDRRLKAFEEETDRTDPGWRWDDIVSALEPVDDEQNAGLRVLTAAQFLPKSWPKAPATRPGLPDPPDDLATMISNLDPSRRLNEAFAEELKSEMAKLEPALAEARTVERFPRGRYPIDWQSNLYATLLPHLEKVRWIGIALSLDVIGRVETGDSAGAFHSWRALVNTSQSIGDEPFLISQLVRLAVMRMAMNSLESILGRLKVSEEELKQADRWLAEEDEKQPDLLYKSIRAERAAMAQTLEMTANGKLNLTEFDGHNPGSFEKSINWPVVQPLVRYGQGPTLALMTRLMEIVKLPPDERRQELDEFEKQLKRLKADHLKHPEMVPAVILIPAVNKVVTAFENHQARLRSARASLALERYRLVQGRWPEKLELLVPNYLARIPEDPYGMGQLQMGRHDGGIKVFYAGPPPTLNGGWDIKDKARPKSQDFGFYLWDPSRRRQPPLKIESD